jgi:hypothetical protein
VPLSHREGDVKARALAAGACKNHPVDAIVRDNAAQQRDERENERSGNDLPKGLVASF